jgi:hypothetical protein
MSEFLAKNLLGNMSLVPTNKLFKSPLGLFFECCGIARVVPITIDEIEVFIYFHIYTILEFDLLIGHPLKNLIQEKPSHRGLNEKLGTAASATPIPCLKNPKVEQQPNHNPFEEAKFISPFVSPRLSSETECPSPLEQKPCPSSNLSDNFCAMDMPKEPILESKRKDSTYEHESFTFEPPFDPCSVLGSPEFVLLRTMCFLENHNHISVLVHKLFKRTVVDIVYHKYCKS